MDPSRNRSGGKFDVESQERDNDRGIDLLSERVGLLKAATQGIKGEVDSQHKVLDNMDMGMLGARGMLGAVNDKFKTVLNDKNGGRTIMIAVGAVVGLFVLWYFMHGK